MSRKKTQQKEGQITETKEQKFARIIPKRVNVTLDKIRLVKNIFGSKSYSMTEEQFLKVYSTLTKAVSEIESAYAGRTQRKKESEKFEL